jgi:hypothetical protein
MAKQIYVGTVGGNKRAINVIIGTLSGNKGKEIPIVGTAAGNRPCMQYYTPTIYVLSQHTSGNADIKKVEFSSPAVTTTIVPDTGVTTAGGIAVNPSLNKLYIATGAARYLKSYDLLGNLIASYLDSVYCKNIIIGVSDNLSWGAGTSYTSIRRTGESLGSTPNSYSTGASTEVVLVGEESVGNRYFFARNSKIGKMRFDTTMFAISKSTVDCADVSPDYYYYYLASYILYKCDTDDALTQMNTTDLSAHYGYTTALFMRINRQERYLLSQRAAQVIET